MTHQVYIETQTRRFEELSTAENSQLNLRFQRGFRQVRFALS